RWSEALAAAHRAMPDPTWLDLDAAPAPRTMAAVG
ncbi:peptidase, partial [Halomonas sp. ND22Bw]